MADRSFYKNAPYVVSQTKKLPFASTKAERSKRGQTRPQAKSGSGLTEKVTDDLLAKEEQYKIIKPQQRTVQEPSVKVVTKKWGKSTALSMCTAKQGKQLQGKTQTSKVSHADKVMSVEDSADCFLAETIRSMEEKMNNTVTDETVEDDHDVLDAVDNLGSGISDAQIRAFKAKLRIMQEELDQLSCEFNKKDDENAKLRAKIKEFEEDRAQLQKTMSIQQTQIEKHKALAEESDKKCGGLQLQVSGLNKEIENLNRSQKQAAAIHSSVEVRLNRALEEVERLKTQLNKTQQINKDKISEEHQSKEKLLAENKVLKKQKAELIVGFKKQLKLIDILKRQKMHFEAAKLLSFTEDEFMKALDWGKL
ncbi:testis-expressed protein 9 isoform X2 [Channa argus]|uniref:testis-expressed protein 9 isoform X2 n=1 Tax=Channa argus TaxID=215402 RepID=UPI00352080D9